MINIYPGEPLSIISPKRYVSQLVSYIRYKTILIKIPSRVCISLWYTHILYTVIKCGASHMHLKGIAYSYCKKELLGSHTILLTKLCIPVLYSLTFTWYIEIKQHKSLCSAIINVSFRFHTRKLPAIFDDMFTRNDDILSHDTRPKTNLVKISVCNAGVTRWNY